MAGFPVRFWGDCHLYFLSDLVPDAAPCSSSFYQAGLSLLLKPCVFHKWDLSQCLEHGWNTVDTRLQKVLGSRNTRKEEERR